MHIYENKNYRVFISDREEGFQKRYLIINKLTEVIEEVVSVYSQAINVADVYSESMDKVVSGSAGTFTGGANAENTSV